MYTTVKVYGIGEQKKIKVTQMKCGLKSVNWRDEFIHHRDNAGLLYLLRIDGNYHFEEDGRPYKQYNYLNGEPYKFYIPECGDDKMAASIARSRSKIFELAYCNPWEYFFTGTLNKSKHDREDLKGFHEKFTHWIRNYNDRRGTNIKYLLVPELHSDGASWHMHGFIMGLPADHLTRFKIGDQMGAYIAERVRNGDLVFNWVNYMDKFGFCNLEPIRSHEAVSKYVTKYINKGLAQSVTELNAHLYYRSRALIDAFVVYKGALNIDITPTYSNEYCNVTWLDYSSALLDELTATAYT